MASRLPLRLVPVLLCLPLLFIVEYDPPTAPFYTLKLGPGLRLADGYILALAGLQCFIVRGRLTVLRLPRQLAIPAFFAMGAWLLSLGYGVLTGGAELFHDWRAIPLGGVVAWIVAAAVRTPDDLTFMWKAFLSFSAAYSLYLLGVYATGGGYDSLPTGRIPVFDGSTLAILEFGGILAFSTWLASAPLGRVSPVLYGLPCIFVVVLSMRRTPWLELAIGLILILCLQGNLRRRSQALALAGLIAAAVVAAVTPSRLEARLRSLDPSARGSPEASTNQDHVNDILDAWDIAKSSPVLGIGLGNSYRTNRIAEWKTESTLVHNGPMHVWVFYGLLGVIAYLTWHVAFFSYLAKLRRQSRRAASPESTAVDALLGAILAWSAALFLITLTFRPWIYSSLQMMVMVGAMWGTVFQRQFKRGVPHEHAA
jgi:hypothetical protein